MISGKVEDLQMAQLGNLKHPDQPVVLNRQLKKNKNLKVICLIFRQQRPVTTREKSLIERELD